MLNVQTGCMRLRMLIVSMILHTFITSSRGADYFVHTVCRKVILLTMGVSFAKHICKIICLKIICLQLIATFCLFMFLLGMVISLVLTEKFNSSILENLEMEWMVSTVKKVSRVKGKKR